MSFQARRSGGELRWRVEVGEGVFLGKVRPTAADLVHQALQGRVVGLARKLSQLRREVRAPKGAEGMAAQSARGDDGPLADDRRQPGAQVAWQERRVAGRGETVAAPFRRRPGEGAGDPPQGAGLGGLDVGDGRQVERRGKIGRTVHREPGAAWAKRIEAPGDQRSASERLARLVAPEPARTAPRENDAGDDHGAEIL